MPEKWRSILACRTCKKDLTAYTADDMLSLISRSLCPHQQFITNIGEEAFSVAPGGSRELRPDLHTNADEADLRVWLHCKNSVGRKKLIFSPGMMLITLDYQPTFLTLKSLFNSILLGKVFDTCLLTICSQHSKMIQTFPNFLLIHDHKHCSPCMLLLGAITYPSLLALGR